MLKDRQDTKQEEARPSYHFYLNDTLRTTGHAIVSVDALLVLAGEDPGWLKEFSPAHIQVYELSSYGNISPCYRDSFIALGKPSVGDVLYGDFKPKQFYTRRYLLATTPKIVLANEQVEPRATASDIVTLAGLGIRYD